MARPALTSPAATRVRRPLLAALAVVGGSLGLSLSALAQDDDELFSDVEDLEDFGTYEGEWIGPRVRSASGRIDRLDLSEGKLVMDGRTYRADPRALQGLRPGQHVSLVYEPIEDQAWISELQLGEGWYGGDSYWGPVF